jgi:heme-degrading monooxygenase HmoA
MFIAMNRFMVHPDHTEEFETIWKSRESHLGKLKGFRSFRLLKGPDREDHVLYSSHTIWASKADFEAWTKSEEFRMAHKGAGDHRHVYIGPPQFEGFEVVLEELAEGETAA